MAGKRLLGWPLLRGRQLARWCAVIGGLASVLLVALPAHAAPATLPASAPIAQAGEGWQCVEVNGQTALNIRGGPGVDYAVVATRQAGERLEADYSRAQNADGYEWVPVRFAGGQGWAITPRLAPCEPVVAPGGQPVLGGVNRDDVLDRYEIAAVARSVVLIAGVRGGRVYAIGTGTVVTPDGLIVTNAHVVDDARLIAIGVLDDINDPPEYRYLGEVVSADDEVDVALLAIRSDVNGVPLSAGSLSLPYIPATLGAADVFRGDPVYIFGYPGIGDDYLVVTSGSIVSVENGTVGGQRMPVWYRTDAEIAPGNSGGLAVNGNGEFVGIPTFVQTETETGGRLGGIRPAEVALRAVLGEDYGAATASAWAGVQPSASPAAGAPIDLELARVTLEHDVVVDGLRGLRIHVAFTIRGWQGRDATVLARFYHDDPASAPLVNPSAPGQYRDKDNAVLTSAPIVPCCAETFYSDIPLFIPYTMFGLTQPAAHPLKIGIEVRADDGTWQRLLSWEFITYTVG